MSFALSFVNSASLWAAGVTSIENDNHVHRYLLITVFFILFNFFKNDCLHCDHIFHLDYLFWLFKKSFFKLFSMDKRWKAWTISRSWTQQVFSVILMIFYYVIFLIDSLLAQNNYSQSHTQLSAIAHADLHCVLPGENFLVSKNKTLFSMIRNFANISNRGHFRLPASDKQI